MQATVTAVLGHISMKCDPNWDDCQKKQACSKVKHMDALAKGAAPGGLARNAKLNPSDYERQRSRGDYYAAKHIEDARKGEPGTDEYSDDCMKYPPNNARRMSADHSHDISYGGDATGPLRWMESSVNSSMGTKIGRTKPEVTHATGFSMDCC
jgi:hypothetical protein